ncbi:MAG: DUF3307 domain-containing protein [Sphaerochaetaceae bacterium]
MEAFLISICCHLIGDFYLQPASLAEKKRHSVGFLCLHSLLYTLPFLIAQYSALQTIQTAMVFDFVYLFGTHILIDAISSRFTTIRAFALDQILHIVVLWIRITIFEVVSPLSLPYVGIVLAVLFIFQPSKVIVNKTLNALSMSSDFSATVHTGYLIGFLERIVILLLCWYGSVATIGLVFTAKTIVRFPEMKENKTLQEMYLIGTFLSVVLALLSYGIILLTKGQLF